MARRRSFCEICSAEYRYTYSGQRTCGRACGQALKASALNAFTCERCGEPGVASGTTRRFCGDKCRSRKQPAVASCAHCGVSFERIRARQSCSTECALALKRAHDRAYNATRPGSDWDRSERPCPHCGCTFTPTYVGQVYHDQACGRRASRKRERVSGSRHSDIHRSRAKRYGREYELITPAKVFDRDGWVCQICFKRVLKNKKAPHPQSPTLDHIIPMSRPGGDHVYANVRLAHFWCNSKRGVGDDSPAQLLLFG